MPFSNDYLLSKAISGDAFNKALEIADSNHVKVVSNNFNKIANIYNLQTVVTGDRENYNAVINFSFDKKMLYNFKCDCPAAKNYKGACKHVLASIIYVSKVIEYKQVLPIVDDISKLKKDNITSPNIKKLIQDNIKQSVMHEKPSSSFGLNISLVPELALYDKSINLKFKIHSQSSNQYVIKNLGEFFDALKENAFYEYGKSLKFFHNIDAFDEFSIELINWLLVNKDALNDDNRSFNLSQNVFDSFFDLITQKGSSTYIVKANNLENIYIIPQNPKLVLEVQEYDDYYTIMPPFIKEYFIGSNKMLISLKDDEYMLCDKDFTNRCSNFISEISNNPYENIISKGDIGTFLSIVMPRFKDYIYLDVDKYESLKKYSAPELKCELYFDKTDNGNISLYINYVYENMQYSFYPNKEKDFSMPRDFIEEVKIENIIANYFDFSRAKDNLLLLSSEEKQFELITIGMPILNEMAIIYTTEKFKTVKIHTNNKLKLNVGISLDSININIESEYNNIDELAAIYKSFLLKKRYHKLSNGAFVDLQESTIVEFADFAYKLGISPADIKNKSIELPVYRSVFIDETLKQTKSLRFERDKDFKQIVRDMRNISDSELEVPQTLNKTLRTYQKNGFRWLKTLVSHGFGGILADDMGLGKTIQVLAVLLSEKEDFNQGLKTKKPLSIVVCPSSLVLNWVEEARKFTPQLNVLAITGNAAIRQELIVNINNYDLVVTSYDLIKRDIKSYLKVQFDYIIADEAQYMKNHTTQNARSVKALRAKSKIALTGTPIENYLSELWSIFDFLMPGYLYNYASFKKRFESKIVLENDIAASNQLKNIIAPFVLRRVKKDVLKELPEKTESVLYANMDAPQRKLYDAFLSNARKKFDALSKDQNATTIQMLALLTRLRQICCDPKLLNTEAYYNIESAKKLLCMDIIQSSIESGHRILLFSNFTSMIDIFANILNSMGIEYLTIVGSTPANKRLSIVQKFNNSNIPIMLISLKAGGTGLNLTGADTVIHYDPWWNLSAQNQATDRAYRIGQKRAVQVYRLIMKGTIEEEILRLQNQKAAVADDILDNSELMLSKLNKEELMALLS